MSLIDELNQKYDRLTNKQRTILDYMTANPEGVCYITLRDLSARVGASEVSILRLCRALGFNSYIELKEAFRKYTQSMLRPGGEPIEPAVKSRETEGVMNILLNERSNLENFCSNIDEDELCECARALINAHEVQVFGHDACKLLADYLTYRLNFFRIKAVSYKLGDSDSVQTALARLTKDDMVIFFSFPPYHLPIYNIARYVEYKGARLAAITDSSRSPATTEAGFNFFCKTSNQFFFNSMTVPMAFICILTSCIAVELGDKFDDIIEDELAVSRFINGESINPLA